MSSVTRVFVQQKVRSIAILKCVGSTSSQMLAIYMTQVLLLGLAGSVLGVALAAGVIAAVPAFVGDLAAMLPVEYGLTGSAVVQGLAIGLLVSMLFSVVPLLEVRHVKPSLLLRQDIPPRRGIRLAEVDRDGRRGRGARGRCLVAGRIAAGRPDAVGRVRGHRVRPASRGRGARARGAAAAVRPVVCAASGGAAHRAAGQPDARHPAGRRPRRILHPWRPQSAGEPAARLRRPGRARRARHVPDRHPAGPARSRSPRSSTTPNGAAPAPTADADAARARRRRPGPRDGPRQLRAGARPRRAVARVHRDLPRRTSRPTRRSSQGQWWERCAVGRAKPEVSIEEAVLYDADRADRPRAVSVSAIA